VRAAIIAGVVLALLAPARAQFCPSYSVTAVPNDRSCGVEAATGTNPSVAEWQPIFDAVAKGPASWGLAGPTVPDIGQGCGKPQARHNVPPVFPCEVLKAIAMNESGWRQFCVPSEPANKQGLSSRTIISFDCGYGIGQVTSGMHIGETPAYDRARVAGDPTYNLATGTQILASKWRATNCVGDHQPRIVEHWYVAAWAYNGLAASNNPNNPNYDAVRPICDPSKGCPGRPYQERVWGWMEHPPSSAHWPAIQPAYPNRGDIGMATKPPNLPEPDCAGPTDCVNKRPVHLSVCLDSPPSDGGLLPDLGAADLAGTDPGTAPPSGCTCQLTTRSSTAALRLLLLSAIVVLIFRLRRS
jgi:hypothetical protein